MHCAHDCVCMCLATAVNQKYINEQVSESQNSPSLTTSLIVSAREIGTFHSQSLSPITSEEQMLSQYHFIVCERACVCVWHLPDFATKHSRQRFVLTARRMSVSKTTQLSVVHICFSV